VARVPICDGMARIGFFCWFGGHHLELARWVAVALLLVVASGWRPRLTGLVHWWIAFSFQASATLIEGGDQATAILALLLVPVTLLDARRWHWQPAPAGEPGERDASCRLVALTALLVIRVQVAGIYLHASIGKLGAQEWVDGTALYYWLTDPAFGAPAWLAPLLRPLLVHGVTVALMTWGVIALELVLGIALVMSRRTFRPLLALGLLLHGSIAMVQGLVSFGFAMSAALILYLRPVEQSFDLRWVTAWWRAVIWSSTPPRPEALSPRQLFPSL